MAERFELNGFYTAGQKKRFSSAMLTRFSCRKFTGPLSTTQWSALCYAAGRCCLKGVRMVLGACDEGFFKASLLPQNSIQGVRRFAALIADTRDPEHLIKTGISGEAFVLLAQDSGVQTCWVSQSYKKKECPVVTAPYEQVLCVIALGLMDPEKESGTGRKKKPVERFARGGSVARWPDWAQKAAQAVRVAPSYQNLQPWDMAFEKEALLFFGIQRQKLEAGIALLHAEAALDARHEWTLGGPEKNLLARVKLQ